VSSTVGIGTRSVDIGITVARDRTMAASSASCSSSERMISGMRKPPSPGTSDPKLFWNWRTFSSLRSSSARFFRLEGRASSRIAWQYSPIELNRSSAL